MKKLVLVLLLLVLSSVSAFAQQRFAIGTLCTATPVAQCQFGSSEKALFGFNVNTTGTAVWVFLLDSAVPVVNGTVNVIRPYQPASSGTLGVSWIPDSLILVNGVTLACSTSAPPTLTLSPSCYFTAEVR
jgi:hypothetical protein